MIQTIQFQDQWGLQEIVNRTLKDLQTEENAEIINVVYTTREHAYIVYKI